MVVHPVVCVPNLISCWRRQSMDWYSKCICSECILGQVASAIIYFFFSHIINSFSRTSQCATILWPPTKIHVPRTPEVKSVASSSAASAPIYNFNEFDFSNVSLTIRFRLAIQHTSRQIMKLKCLTSNESRMSEKEKKKKNNHTHQSIAYI